MMATSMLFLSIDFMPWPSSMLNDFISSPRAVKKTEPFVMTPSTSKVSSFVLASREFSSSDNNEYIK
jgi:hypothetical protein